MGSKDSKRNEYDAGYGGRISSGEEGYRTNPLSHFLLLCSHSLPPSAGVWGMENIGSRRWLTRIFVYSFFLISCVVPGNPCLYVYPPLVKRYVAEGGRVGDGYRANPLPRFLLFVPAPFLPHSEVTKMA